MAATQKGLGKMTDFVPHKFDGSKPQEFPQFIKHFELGVKTLEIHVTKQHLLFLNSLDGRPREVAEKLVECGPDPHRGGV